MKKRLAAIVCLMMLFSTAAMAQQAPHVDFRGLELGMTLGEIQQIPTDAPEYVFLELRQAECFDPCTLQRLTEDVFSDEGARINDDFNSGMFLLENGVRGEVAGYNAYLSWRFIRPVVDGVVSADDSQAVFYAGSYQVFNWQWGKEEYRAAADDLKNKLTGIYGEAETKLIRSQTPYSKTKNMRTGEVTENYGEYEFSYWQGEDDKQVILSYYDKSRTLRISYVWMGARQMIDDAMALWQSPEQEDAAENLSGL